MLTQMASLVNIEIWQEADLPHWSGALYSKPE